MNPEEIATDSAVKMLLIDDDADNLQLIESALQQQGLRIFGASDPEVGLKIFQDERPEMVLLDLVMPAMSGMEVLARILAIDPGVEVILITGHYSPESAVEAIRRGAADYLTKPLDFAVLRDKVATFIDHRKRRRESLALEKQMVHAFQLEGIVGRSPLMLDVFAAIRRIAPHFRTALITGETGTGKELAARALHRLSPVAAKTFAVCNCSALVDTLLETELFGYVRGAFTGATQDKIGLFEYADGGTVFLDEIGDMPLTGQAKLLRVLQNQEVQRVGSPIPRKLNIRVIAATNRNLVAMVKDKTFREDLYYRLSMAEILLPPLADRKEDIALLYKHFVDKFSTQFNKPLSGITRRAQVVLGRYHWPGNVRELENVIGNACMMADGPVIDVKDIPARIRVMQPSTLSTQVRPDNLMSMEDLQATHLLQVLDRVEGDKVRAAEILGIARATVYNMLAKIEAKRKVGSCAT
jgi:DNA-binding NtrC family response regulator